MPADQAESNYASTPPRIRRDEEFAAVTGELHLDQTVPDVPVFGAPQTSPVRRKRRRQKGRAAKTVATRTAGGTVVTFPPQSAPGSGSAPAGRITAPNPIVDPWPTEADRPTPGAGPQPAVPDPVFEPWDESVSARSDGEVVADAGERAGFLVAPADGARARKELGEAAESGPWLLVDPDDGPLADVGPQESEPSDGTDGSQPSEAATLDADLEYLFAARTIDIGQESLDIGDQPGPDQEQGQEGEADGYEPDEGLDELLADLSAATDEAASVDEAGWIEGDAHDQADTDSGLVIPELADAPLIIPAVPEAESSPVSDEANDQPGFQRGQPVQRRPVRNLIQDPVPSGGLFFDTPSSKRAERERQAEKSRAEVFASETSVLPARTRRGDTRSIEEQYDAANNWFNMSGELPLVQVAGEQPTARKPRRWWKVMRRLFLILVLLAVAAGVLYVALDSIYI